MFKKFTIIFMILMISALSFVKSSTFVCADDDDVCEYGSDSYNAKACNLKRQEELKEIKEKMEQAEQDEEEAKNLAREFGEKIETLNAEIAILEPQIEELGIKIEELEISIKENEAKVESLKQRILKRMASAQGQMHFNPYLDFILGSDGFSDMLRRSYGVEAITSKEEEDRNELIEILTQLQKDKEECDAAKAELDAKKVELEANKAQAEEMQEYYQEMAAKINEEIQKLRDESSRIKAIIQYSEADIKQLEAFASQYGMVHPVSGSTISAGIPAYPASFGGGMHIGIDYAASYGTAILAPADGIIISSVNGCSNDHGNNLGDRCGYVEGKGMASGGNQLRMMFSVNGIVFGLIAFHMLDGSVHEEGTVAKGTKIGEVGSSGNSSGAHCHIELFYLGKGEKEDIKKYLAKDYTVGFNLGYNTGSLCYNKGSAPCRLDGRYYFGESEVELVW